MDDELTTLADDEILDGDELYGLSSDADDSDTDADGSDTDGDDADSDSDGTDS